jgi:hypothetical protein
VTVDSKGPVYLDALRQLFDLSAPADDAPQRRYVGIDPSTVELRCTAADGNPS